MQFSLDAPKLGLAGPWLCIALAMVAMSGCKRGFYRRSADEEVAAILQQKGRGPTWQLKNGFTIEPDRRSRFYDPTNPVDPALPLPAPQLYNYDLPELITEAPEERELRVRRSPNAEGEEDVPLPPESEPLPDKDSPAGDAPSPNVPSENLPGESRQSATRDGSDESGQLRLRAATATSGHSSRIVSHMRKEATNPQSKSLGRSTHDRPDLNAHSSRIRHLAPPMPAREQRDGGQLARSPAARRHVPTASHKPPSATASATASHAPEPSLPQISNSPQNQQVVASSVVPAAASRVEGIVSEAPPPLALESALMQDGREDASEQVDAPKQSPSQAQAPDGGAAQPEELPPPKPKEEDSIQNAIRIVPIPQEAWQSLPDACLKRMLEFDTVREEYERTFKQQVTQDQLDPARRVNLENILEIALINNREYQTRKETLYRVALRLTLARFDFDLRFLSRGNGTSLNYTHNRVAGIEVNRLGIPSGLGITRSLYTAGDLVARFANDVVLTFNGPSGYSSSVGSELLIELTQPLIQRDVRFEPLTQAERDVVYAARDFVRFRKELFRDLAVQYYNLLLTYRSIAINTQDYFSNLRGFIRAEAYEGVGQLPSFQVDQFEQNALRSRGNLINSCNSLEQAIDRLKLRIGLPTEMPLNVDLSELEELTLSDEATVIREQILRKIDYLSQQQSGEGTQVAVTAAAELARRMLNLANVSLQLGQIEQQEVDSVQRLVARLEVEDARIAQQNSVSVLEDALASSEINLLPMQIYLRTNEPIDLSLDSINRELKLMRLHLEMEENGQKSLPAEQAGAGPTASSVQELEQELNRLRQVQREIAAQVNDPTITNEERTNRIPRILELTDQLRSDVERLESRAVQYLRMLGVNLAENEDDLKALLERVLARTSQPPYGDAVGLTQVEVDVDQAMLTALVQRLDLLNQRGRLADAWRQIKYAGDDLRSVLNVSASQSIRNRTGSNNPFDFTFDDSTTRLSLDFDTPLNRRAERNNFRLALINYNVALRNVIEAQDGVKFDIRNDLRAIELDRNQYEISIASAALAYERVVSTRLQLVLGSSNVTARDFLEAQQAYTASLSAVAQQHIGYIIDRIQLFLDLEQLQVNELNFWEELRNEEYPFIPNINYRLVAPDGYGCLPRGPWYSDCLRRMERVPPGVSAIHKAADKKSNNDGMTASE